MSIKRPNNFLILDFEKTVRIKQLDKVPELKILKKEGVQGMHDTVLNLAWCVIRIPYVCPQKESVLQ